MSWLTAKNSTQGTIRRSRLVLRKRRGLCTSNAGHFHHQNKGRGPQRGHIESTQHTHLVRSQRFTDATGRVFLVCLTQACCRGIITHKAACGCGLWSLSLLDEPSLELFFVFPSKQRAILTLPLLYYLTFLSSLFQYIVLTFSFLSFTRQRQARSVIRSPFFHSAPSPSFLCDIDSDTHSLQPSLL